MPSSFKTFIKSSGYISIFALDLLEGGNITTDSPEANKIENISYQSLSIDEGLGLEPSLDLEMIECADNLSDSELEAA